jgi:hypothetical protein
LPGEKTTAGESTGITIVSAARSAPNGASRKAVRTRVVLLMIVRLGNSLAQAGSRVAFVAGGSIVPSLW